MRRIKSEDEIIENLEYSRDGLHTISDERCGMR